jgi:hypothetical protein
VVRRQSVFIFDLTTNGAVTIQRGRDNLRGKPLVDGLTLLDGDVVTFGQQRRYQFSRAKRV